MTRTWIVCYDVADQKRLRRVARIMEAHGQRVLESVFECHLTNTIQQELRAEVIAELVDNEDSVRWYPMCAGCGARMRSQGDEGPTEDARYHIV